MQSSRITQRSFFKNFLLHISEEKYNQVIKKAPQSSGVWAATGASKTNGTMSTKKLYIIFFFINNISDFDNS